eukprot:TRINITY_DN1742_c0_g1_i1.p1 TRINITY_DN1742_c0_g1~~TRINITY_DN1742_c0_g1_i1.p1  ORF type:complete len:421 (-),score=13.92 TRINITY_DN1742_c0_g1_i1:30-1292(-)
MNQNAKISRSSMEAIPPEKSHEASTGYLPKEKEQLIGCVVGAFCGDAAGGTLEFLDIPITEKEASEALEMKGGGLMGLGPGQITDDSELALSLANGLAESEGKLNLDRIVRYYGEWIKSGPFDIGTTTGAALLEIDVAKPDAKAVRQRALERNMHSESNGCMMRITPLVIWGHKLSDEDLDAAVRADVSLTHPNEIPQQACVAYCICIKHLLKNGGDRMDAIEKTKKYLQDKKYSTALDWLHMAEFEKGKIVSECKKKLSSLRHGFIWAIHLLRCGCEYEEAIRITLKQGGDTDTNACIVGGMIGAAIGYSRIPQKMVKTILSFSAEKSGKGIKRPNWLNPGKVLFEILEKVLKVAPDKLEITYDKPQLQPELQLFEHIASYTKVIFNNLLVHYLYFLFIKIRLKWPLVEIGFLVLTIII